MNFRSNFARMTVVAAVLATVPSLAAQQVSASLRVSVVLSADTVRVGEPFTIGVTTVSSDQITVPPLLPSGEGWEQLQIARVETSDTEFRVYYRLVAWHTDGIELPDLSLSVGPDGGRDYSVSLPVPVVRSIIPASVDAPLLQSPRPPIEPGFPWPLLLVALILLALILWWLKHRITQPAVVPSAGKEENGAAARARAAVLALREHAESGSVAASGFYDELEQILRHYLSSTRDWPTGQPVRESRALAGATMRDLHRQAVLARFAAVGWSGPRLVADADVSLDWLTVDEQ
jgi:hypothetical protein